MWEPPAPHALRAMCPWQGVPVPELPAVPVVHVCFCPEPWPRVVTAHATAGSRVWIVVGPSARTRAPRPVWGHWWVNLVMARCVLVKCQWCPRVLLEVGTGRLPAPCTVTGSGSSCLLLSWLLEAVCDCLVYHSTSSHWQVVMVSVFSGAAAVLLVAIGLLLWKFSFKGKRSRRGGQERRRASGTLLVLRISDAMPM